MLRGSGLKGSARENDVVASAGAPFGRGRADSTMLRLVAGCLKDHVMDDARAMPWSEARPLLERLRPQIYADQINMRASLDAALALGDRCAQAEERAEQAEARVQALEAQVAALTQERDALAKQLSDWRPFLQVHGMDV